MIRPNGRWTCRVLMRHWKLCNRKSTLWTDVKNLHRIINPTIPRSTVLTSQNQGTKAAYYFLLIKCYILFHDDVNTANLPVFHLKGTCRYTPYFYLTFFKNFLNHLMIIMIISAIISVVGSRWMVHYSDRQRQVGRGSGRQTTQYRKCWSAIHRHRDFDSAAII